MAWSLQALFRKASCASNSAGRVEDAPKGLVDRCIVRECLGNIGLQQYYVCALVITLCILGPDATIDGGKVVLLTESVIRVRFLHKSFVLAG